MVGSGNTFDGIVASLYEAMLDDARWSVASALIDDACNVKGSGLFIGEEVDGKLDIHFARFHSHGRRRQDLEDSYVNLFHTQADWWPYLRGLPRDRPTHVSDLPANAVPRPSIIQNGSLLCFDGLDGSHIVWAIGGPAGPGGWQPDQTGLIERLAPYVRHFVCVRQAFTSQPEGSALAEWLCGTGFGVIHLGWRGRIMGANPVAGDLLQCGDGLQVCDGLLGARLTAENTRLKELLERALGQGESGQRSAADWMTISRSSGLPSLMLYVTSVDGPELDFGIRRAVVLVFDPEGWPRGRLKQS